MMPAFESETETTPLHRISTVDALVAQLRERILDGDIPAGSALREADLADQYGVGRWSVRAALQALVHEGLVRHAPHRGAYVPTFTGDDIADLFFLRIALESEVVRRIVDQELDISSAEAAVKALAATDRSTRWGDVADADLAFHRSLVQAVDNPRLSRVFASLQAELRLCLAQLSHRYDDPSQVAEDHRRIVSSISKGNADNAVKQIRAHLEQGIVDIVESLPSQQELDGGAN